MNRSSFGLMGQVVAEYLPSLTVLRNAFAPEPFVKQKPLFAAHPPV